jgi:hypothetical protein
MTYEMSATLDQSTRRDMPNIINKSNISLVTGLQPNSAVVVMSGIPVMSTALGKFVQMN